MRVHVKLDDTTTIDGTISGIDPRIENGVASSMWRSISVRTACATTFASMSSLS